MSAAHDLEFAWVLQHAHLVQDRAGIDDLGGRDKSRARAQAHAVEGLDQLRVERGVPPQHVKHPAHPLEKLGQAFDQLMGGECGVGPVVAHRTVDTGSVAVPDLRLVLARLNEEREDGSTIRSQNGRGMGMVEPGQIPKVAVLSKRKVSVGGTRCEASAKNNGHRIGTHGFEKSPSSFREHIQSLAQAAFGAAVHTPATLVRMRGHRRLMAAATERP